MNPLDYILAGTGTIGLVGVLSLTFALISAYKGERAALAVANINDRAQRYAERERDHYAEHLAQALKERDNAIAQLATTQTAAIVAAKEHVDAIKTEVTDHPDRAGDVVGQLLARGPTVVAGVTTTSGHGDAEPPTVQPAAVAGAGGVLRGP